MARTETHNGLKCFLKSEWILFPTSIVSYSEYDVKSFVEKSCENTIRKKANSGIRNENVKDVLSVINVSHILL